MYRIVLNSVPNKYEYEELIKVFLRPDQYTLLCGGEETCENQGEPTLVFNGGSDKNRLKREIYRKLSQLTGQLPEWGILTGVRPVKLTAELLEKQDEAAVREALLCDYLISQEKAELLLSISRYQSKILPSFTEGGVGLYIGIPFCPTRCLYCSFTSNQVQESEIERYLTALHREIDFAGEKMRERQLHAESVYIGGGTPTTLTAEMLHGLFSHINEAFDLKRTLEFTVEAGRPDTITAEKLRIIRESGVARISINPQSMKEETLKLIGRSHTPEEIRKAFQMARDAGIPVVNADVIAGLPAESPDDFEKTLNELVRLGAENITVHTLAVKRASKLKDADPNFHYKQGGVVVKMLAIAQRILSGNGYRPYYLYRQKHMAGSFENTGWCREGAAGLYNIRIMEEKQTMIALGAGGISKVYHPAENRLERVANVSNYEIYIERIDEMLKRKRENLFRR